MLKSIPGAAGAAALIVAVAAAFAAPPYVVDDVGGDTSNTSHTFEAQSASYAIFEITGAGGVVSWGCLGCEASGTIHGGTNTTGLIAEITNTTWTDCYTFLDIRMSIYQTGSWGIDTSDTANSGDDSLNADITAAIASLGSSTSSPPRAHCASSTSLAASPTRLTKPSPLKPGTPPSDVQ